MDLARCTTIARRRKLDMVSALEASLESPQIPPEARDRIRGFLDLYTAAARAMGELPTDVFVRRLIERVGFRRQRLFAAHPEAVERLRNLSRLGELAADWTRREPSGSSREFVRYLVAVSEAGVSPEEETAIDGRRGGAGDAARRGQGARVRPASTSSGSRPMRSRDRHRAGPPTCRRRSAAAASATRTPSAGSCTRR